MDPQRGRGGPGGGRYGLLQADGAGDGVAQRLGPAASASTRFIAARSSEAPPKSRSQAKTSSAVAAPSTSHRVRASTARPTTMAIEPRWVRNRPISEARSAPDCPGATGLGAQPRIATTNSAMPPPPTAPASSP